MCVCGGGGNCVNTLSLEACLKNVLCSVNVQCSCSL